MWLLSNREGWVCPALCPAWSPRFASSLASSRKPPLLPKAKELLLQKSLTCRPLCLHLPASCPGRLRQSYLHQPEHPAQRVWSCVGICSQLAHYQGLLCSMQDRQEVARNAAAAGRNPGHQVGRRQPTNASCRSEVEAGAIYSSRAFCFLH